MKNFFLQLPSYLLLILFSTSYAQDQPYLMEDADYVSNVRSVQFFNGGNQTSYPIAELGYENLTLSFDDMDGDVKNYRYKIIHCNIDWTPSNLSYHEYLDRFDVGDILDYSFSFNTIRNYTHYEVRLPNGDVAWTLSGNYLIYVFDDDPENPVLTRRFVIYEQRVTFNTRLTPPVMFKNRKTHQEIDFSLSHRGFDIRNPRSELGVNILQNGRWDNAIIDLPPFLDRGNYEVDYNYQNKIVFPGLKEWRQIDIRSIQTTNSDMAKIERFDDGYFLTLRKDPPRANIPYQNYIDINGQFVIENRDAINDQEGSEYSDVLFRLPIPQLNDDQEVYLFGQFTNFNLRPDYKMVYNHLENAYVGKAQLKQGAYNYYYAVKSKEEEGYDIQRLEGSSFETENDYFIIVYYKPFGARHHRIIGLNYFNTRA